VVGGVALVVVGGAIAAILMMFVLNRATDDQGGSVKVPLNPTTTSTASIDSSPTERPADDFADTFAFRNVFQPTVKITLTPDPNLVDSTDGSTPATVDVPQDTLLLSSVSTVDGSPVANLVWNGATYALGEGDAIPDTPWQVLSISGDTVVMLYGDSRVTLTVGQGISK
jgi:hypothetical protein